MSLWLQHTNDVYLDDDYYRYHNLEKPSTFSNTLHDDWKIYLQFLYIYNNFVWYKDNNNKIYVHDFFFIFLRGCAEVADSQKLGKSEQLIIGILENISHFDI